ncbi:MAG: tRNA-dihydrouridine synthase family protein [Corallococcus sp.]|nr:tRNA-dihydrouridine synthase family protein [Corallococcus sp.]MCM1359508.1 tRNA-dihydrouridine synthase family protein [Corallococcus sp.]
MSVETLFANAPARTILAPMAGYTDAAFRSICRDYGVGLTVTEMVSSKAIVMNNALTKTLLAQLPSDKPSFAQIFGHEPDVMAASVQIPEIVRYDGVDINMGCPVKKIVNNGDGSALMENPRLAAQCVSAVKKAIGANQLLSVKFRLGVEDGRGVADFAKAVVDAGADFVTVHFRTRRQMYSGTADYSALSQIVKCGVPVFANGDVTTREQYLRLTDNGAFGVAVGRGALGKPYVFAQIADMSYNMDVENTVLRHIDLLNTFLPHRVVNNEMKKHVAFYLKGMRGAKQTLIKVMTAKDVAQIIDVVCKFFLENPHYRLVTEK